MILNEVTQWLERLKRANVERTVNKGVVARGVHKTKTCGLCGEEFAPLEDDRRLICYSETCMKEYDDAKNNPPAVVKAGKHYPIKIKEPAPESKTRAERRELYEQNKIAGFVYLMRSGNGYYKIGISKEVGKRLRGLQRQFPIQIEVIHSFACRNYRNVEGFLHAKYSSKRVEYEWFNLDTQDVEWIMSVKNYELG